MATNHRQPHRLPGHPGATPSRPPACRDSRLTLRARYVELDHAHEEAAVAALADLLAPYVDAPEEKAA